MRLNINLATQPYEDVRQFTRRWAVIVGVLLFTAAVLSYAATRVWQHYRIISGDVARERQTLDKYQAQQLQDVTILNRPENHDVREKSEFLNELIRRKEVSWTKIFVDLERLLPPRVHVVSIRPEIKEDQIQIKMALAGNSREAVSELVRRMENSATFRNARVVSDAENVNSARGQDTLKVDVSAIYVPRVEWIAGGNGQ